MPHFSGLFFFAAAAAQWKKVSEPAKDLIRKMLAYVPTMRISARDALEHEWLKTTDAATDSIDVPSLESTILNIR